MTNEMKFAETVVLIDAAYIDKVTADLAAHFGEILNRELPPADLPMLLECLLLDAGMRPAPRSVQVLFIYDADCKRLSHLKPSDLDKELNGVAFNSQLGEITLYAFEPSDMATRAELFVESLKLVADAKEVKQLIVLAAEEYGDKVCPVLDKAEGKDPVTLFSMNPPAQALTCQWETMGFAILRALGIKADEL